MRSDRYKPSRSVRKRVLPGPSRGPMSDGAWQGGFTVLEDSRPIPQNCVSGISASRPIPVQSLIEAGHVTFQTRSVGERDGCTAVAGCRCVQLCRKIEAGRVHESGESNIILITNKICGLTAAWFVPSHRVSSVLPTSAAPQPGWCPPTPQATVGAPLFRDLISAFRA
jgi:hypothetical protein